jgi:kinesin family member 6/9
MTEIEKTKVKVVVRTRPTANFASKNLKLDLEKKTIEAFIPKDDTQGLINNQQENWKFKFNEFLHNSSQEEVYDMTSRDLVHSVMEGYNATLLAYGQTGAGKTYTMSGGSQNYKFRGIIPRAISQVFTEIQNKPELSYVVRVSYAEIYNELIYDLLSSTPPSEQTGNIMIQDDPKFGITVKGLTLVLCGNEEEALNQLFEGETNRTIAEHRLNKNSTRSHCIYTLHLESRSRVESSEKVTYSKLNLVDLAGSERTKKTGSEGLTLTEANFINKSLSYMEQVVIALSEKNRDHVPYRQSKLTYMLKDSIGGNSKTLMVANIWPEPEHMEETISTLRFATRMMRVSNEATKNVELDPSQLIERYKREIKDLKQELAMHDTLANRGRVVYEPYTPDQRRQIELLSEKFLDGQVEEIEIESIRQVKEILSYIRKLYKRNLGRSGEESKNKSRPETQKTGGSKGIEAKENEDREDGVGQEEISSGFGIGKANPNARPADSTALESRNQFHQEEEFEEKKVYSPEESKKFLSKTPLKQPQIDKNQAFMEFKNGDGREIDTNLNQNKEDQKQRKNRLKSITKEVNQIKKSIDECKSMVDNIRKDRGNEEEGIIDEEEFAYIKKLKDLKKSYRNHFDQMRSIKDELNIIDQNIEYAREKLISEFEIWYEKKFGVLPVVSRESTRPNLQVVEEKIGEDLDADALAYIKAKRNVQTLHKAKKTLGTIGKS